MAKSFERVMIDEAHSSDASETGQIGWIRPQDGDPEDEELVLAIAYGRSRNVEFIGAVVLARYYEKEGWELEEYYGVENLKVTYWMRIPPAPGEEKL